MPSVLEECFPNSHLIGTAADVEVLQQVLDDGPFTESPEAELVALGTALGDLFGQSFEQFNWVRVSDDDGVSLGMRYAETSIVIFPRDMIIKRVERGNEEVDLRMLYEGVIEGVQNLIDSGEYQ